MQSHLDTLPSAEPGAVSPQPRGETLPWSQWIALAILGAAVAWAYWPILVSLVQRWEQDDQYSHGYLVPLFSGWLIWQRWGRIGPARPAAWGLLLVIAGLAMLACGQLFFYESIAQVAIIPALTGLVILGGGSPGSAGPGRHWPSSCS
jgi:drug/metabolite transporter (DMT)-like permease